MFALSGADLAQPVLGCGDGPASFNAEATERGAQVVSCDPLYCFPPSAIERRVRETYDSVLDQLRANLDDFVWERFRDPEHLGSVRLAAMRRFLADYPEGRAEGRYLDAELPMLPFPDGTFGLALCSHFLFLYSAQHDFAFHLAALRELGRVAREVRVFPLLALGGVLSPHVEPAAQALIAEGWEVERVRVPYEFQRGGNQMLRLRPGPAA